VHQIDVLISDVGMPDVDGYELMRRVRAEPGTTACRLPAVALTAYARELDRKRALEVGFQAHVSIPVEPAELVRVVADIGFRNPNYERDRSLNRAEPASPGGATMGLADARSAPPAPRMALTN
jgi:CheY-like chemotaxis protein